MAKRIDNLYKQAVDYVERQESLGRQQSDNTMDKGLVQELFSGISDDEAYGSLEKHDNVLKIDANLIQEGLGENKEKKADTMHNTDEYLVTLEDNLGKIEQMKQTSDLLKNTSSEFSIKKRISELHEIKKLLGEEAEKEKVLFKTDNISQDGQSNSNDFLKSLKVSVEKSVPSEYIMGILCKNYIANSVYSKIVKERYYNATLSAKKAFDKATAKLIIQDGSFDGQINENDTIRMAGPHFLTKNVGDRKRGVYFNVDNDTKNPRGAGTTYYHELGHMIDSVLGDNKEHGISNNSKFAEALVKDAMSVEEIYNTPDKLQKFREYMYQDDTTHSLSDILEATTNGRIKGAYGHSLKYWENKRMITTEAFAHFFEASMGGGKKLTYLKKYFPTAFREFDSILNAVETDDSRILEKSR